ncbi:MAG: helix-turn-helix domain-containing protein, partial [Ignavibacteria bacterium]
MKKYKVTLSLKEIEELESITRKGRHRAQVVKNAIILLNVDEGEYGKQRKDSEVSKILDIPVQTIENIRKRFVTESFESALYGKAKNRI